MKVLVTGGSGHLGQYVVQELLAHGHSVVNADRRPPVNGGLPGAASARYVETAVGDVGQVAGTMAGCDGVIHLGAIPSPYRHADEVVFNNNVQGTFAVFQAASLLGVSRVVFASSLSALGTAYSPEVTTPVYAPVDEAHPLLNHDCYGLSKEVDERTGQMFHRRCGMGVTALRFHWVAAPGQAKQAAAGLDPGADPNSSRVLWGYVDARDAASICRLALEQNADRFDVFNVTAADTLAAIPTEELLRTYAPAVELRAPLPGFASAFSTAHAKRVLGWAPRYSWRDE